MSTDWGLVWKVLQQENTYRTGMRNKTKVLKGATCRLRRELRGTGYSRGAMATCRISRDTSGDTHNVHLWDKYSS